MYDYQGSDIISIRIIAERISARQLIRDVYIRKGLACETRQPPIPKLEELRMIVRRKANMRVRIPSNWGEPERAPHLMSTAVCMFVVYIYVCRRTANICLRTSYGYEYSSGSTCTLITASAVFNTLTASCNIDGLSETLASYMACASPR